MQFHKVVWMQLLEVSIVAVNIILRKACFSIVNKLGYDQETKRLLYTTRIVFWMQFINTAILLFIVNANMTESPLTFGLIGGSLQDFNRTWFKLIGNTIIGTMIIGVIQPLLESLIEKLTLSLERCADRGCCPKSKYDTKKTSIAEYIELYSGINHSMHYGYSSLLLIIFVTFMFGFGIPILFPIAAFSIRVLYLVEKYQLYYFYKQPPAYDERITRTILSILRMAPPLYLVCGYWMLTNQQLLSNDHLHAMYSEADKPRTDHDLTLIISKEGWVSPYWPIGSMAIACILFCLLADRIHK